MRRPLTILALLALTALLVPATAGADECDQLPELGPRACKTVEAGGGIAAGACDQVPGSPPEACGVPRGQAVDAALVDAYEEGTLHRLHALQRELGASVPLAEAQVLATHNSYNSSSYWPTLSSSDANQWYGLADQLRLDMRALELDVHWWYGPQGRRAVLCHGTGPHLGCSNDRPLEDGLAEIRTWLDANSGEVVMIDLEDHLEGQEGHDAAAAAIDAVLGDLVYKAEPVAECRALPLDLSFDDIRQAGAQVLIVSSCGSGAAWQSLVHSYGEWKQGLFHGYSEFPGCGGDYARADYLGAWTRYWEDTTWLSAMAGANGERLTADVTRELMRCGLSQPSFDKVHPHDDRLAAALWSWAEDADLEGGTVAVQSDDGRFRAVDVAADTRRRAACRDDDGTWFVTTAAVPFQTADLACWGRGGKFDVPGTGLQNELLREAADGAEVWLDYAVVDGAWTPRAAQLDRNEGVALRMLLRA